MVCVTSHPLKWVPLPPNDVSRIAQHVGNREGKKERAKYWNKETQHDLKHKWCHGVFCIVLMGRSLLPNALRPFSRCIVLPRIWVLGSEYAD